MLTASFPLGHSYVQEIKHPDVRSVVINYEAKAVQIKGPRTSQARRRPQQALKGTWRKNALRSVDTLRYQVDVVFF